MSVLEKSVNDFSEALASRSPVPGGGGASALVGALAADLGHMVCVLTTGKKKYADVEEDIQRLMQAAQQLSDSLKACVDGDAEAFEPLSKAYAIDKNESGRDEIMEKCLMKACSVPLEIFDLCCEVIDMQQELAEKGSALVVSDAATGAALAKGAMMGAAMNVVVNTRMMKKTEYAEKINGHLDEKLGIYMAKADEIFCGVYGRSI